MKTRTHHDLIQLIPCLGTRGQNMLTLSVWLLISAVVAGITGLFIGAGARRDSDDAAQAEYLSRWSDLKRLRKQR